MLTDSRRRAGARHGVEEARRRVACAAALLAVLWGTPARALAQRGGRLMFFMLAGPMVISPVGLALAALGLRFTRSPLLWWFLCGLLGLNAALLGGQLALAPLEATAIIFLLAHLAVAGAMLFTVPKDVAESKAKIVLARLGSVAGCGLGPGLLTYLFLH